MAQHNSRIRGSFEASHGQELFQSRFLVNRLRSAATALRDMKDI
jgi:hypothetical protein